MQSKSIRDEDVIQDLKDFITATVRSEIKSELSVQLAPIKENISELQDGLERVDQKIDDLASSVGEAISTSNDETGDQLKNHETRIKRLELRTA
jgi:uncharacterized coiled-coil protein SlyX